MTDADPRILGLLVEQEAQRALHEAELQADPARIADGWTRRFLTDRGRVEEVRSIYEELGFEVAADPVRADTAGPGCDECLLVTLERFVTIYTRPRSAGGGAEGGNA